MSKIKKSLLLVSLTTMCALGAASAYATVSSNAEIATPTPVPTMTPPPRDNDKDELSGRCHFEGVFDDGKSGTFVSECSARFEIERRKRDDMNSDSRDGRDRDDNDDFLRVVCNGERIYSDNVRARFSHDGDREVDLILRGHGHSAPSITIKDIELGRRSRHNDSSAIIQYQANGYSYTLYGRCDLEKDDRRDDDRSND